MRTNKKLLHTLFTLYSYNRARTQFPANLSYSPLLFHDSLQRSIDRSFVFILAEDEYKFQNHQSRSEKEKFIRISRIIGTNPIRFFLLFHLLVSLPSIRLSMVAKTKKKKKKSTIPTTTRPTNARNNTFTGIAPVQSRGLKPVGGIHTGSRLIYLRILFLHFFFSPFSRARLRGEASRVESSGEASECRVTSHDRPINDGEVGDKRRETEVTAPILWKQRFFTAARDFASPFQRNFLRNIIYHRENRTDFDTDFCHIDRW